MLERTCLLVVAVAAFGVTTAEPAEGRFRLILNGALAPAAVDVSRSRTLTQNVEEGRFESSLEGNGGRGFEVGLQYGFTRRVALAVSGGLARRDLSGRFDASLPHPFFFDRDRLLEGPVDGLDYQESALHVDLVWTGSTGSLDVGLFAGAAFLRVEADLPDTVEYTDVYPYDTVTFTGVTSLTAKDGAIGPDVGARLDWRLSPHVALGAQARFNRATARLPTGEGVVEVEAGGFQVAGGLRLIF